MDNSIVAMIPLKDGHALEYDVLKALMNQTVKIHIMAISRPMESLNILSRLNNGFVSMTKCRNLIKEESLKQYNDDKFLLLNRDVILKTNTDVEDMINYLDNNEKCAGIAINTRNKRTNIITNKLNKKHVDIACMIVRRILMEKINFSNIFNSCNCSDLIRCVNDNNLGYVTYLR